MAVLTVLADQDRFGQPVTFLNGQFNTKVSGTDTGGALCMIDTVRTRRGGPPLHFHYEQDELFFVQEGDFRFLIGEELFDLKPGDFIFGPRRIPHAFANLSETGRLMVGFQPAGTMEAFFAAGLRDPNSEAFRELSRAHGMEVVGPPLAL
ncbi:MAG: Cupin 2 conserved barrel domain protein [Devosia sp.]|uniref:cupin domain-containing protein n=1 Tax=Devosia sp. TaxID=1871048 RepID=UPI0026216316|nr:cupin domain-containing protein [Devosia sp.]MDB5587571.1 Cupin 2 conserved barrel domain protein [Devosia sp.]